MREVFTRAKIVLTVDELIFHAHELVGLAKKMQQEGTTLFAILVRMRRADSIVIFRNHECLDSKLPLYEARAEEIVPGFGFSFA